MIEDTSFLLDLLRGDDHAEERLGMIERTNTPEKLASITVCELHEGVARSNHPKSERERVLDVLQSKPVVPADRAIMRRAGELRGELVADGEVIDREDCIIAATALDLGEPVVTGDGDHFERVPGLDVRSY